MKRTTFYLNQRQLGRQSKISGRNWRHCKAQPGGSRIGNQGTRKDYSGLSIKAGLTKETVGVFFGPFLVSPN